MNERIFMVFFLCAFHGKLEANTKKCDKGSKVSENLGEKKINKKR
jgi:hypothetical protein